jgi:hypothetical protein
MSKIETFLLLILFFNKLIVKIYLSNVEIKGFNEVS